MAFRGLPTNVPLSAAVTLYAAQDWLEYTGATSVTPSPSTTDTAGLSTVIMDEMSILSENDTDADVEMPWNSTRNGNHIKTLGTRVTKTQTGWGGGTAIIGDIGDACIIPEEGGHGCMRWSFKIGRGTQSTIGIVTGTYDCDTDEYVNKTTRGWGFYQVSTT